MVKQLQPGQPYIFPKGSRPQVVVQRKPKPFEFNRRERLLISQIAENARETELGDGVKLSAHKAEIDNASAVIDVTDILWSEFLGIRMLYGDEPQERPGLQAQILLSRNLIISQDGYVLISKAGDYRSPLNGFVDSDTLVGDADSGLIASTILKELDEEYGIEGDLGNIDIHSVALQRMFAQLSVLAVIGSVSVPMDFWAILESQSKAQDKWENPHIIGVRHTKESLMDFAGGLGDGHYLKRILDAYASRVF